jgi:hypothetical protein
MHFLLHTQARSETLRYGNKRRRLEPRSLNLVSDMQAELREALNSLGGNTREGLHDGYLGYSAGHINRAVEGYVYLRKSGRIDASKHLVRTSIEAVIRIRAIRKKPELLFRIAFTEFSEDKKWVRSTAGADVRTALSAIEKHWADFKQAYHAKYPEHALLEEEISLRRTAECAGIAKYYDTHYRLYCRFTHAAFRATTGNLNEFDREDNRTMALCALSALDAVSSIGGQTPNLKSLRERLDTIDKS